MDAGRSKREGRGRLVIADRPEIVVNPLRSTATKPRPSNNYWLEAVASLTLNAGRGVKRRVLSGYIARLVPRVGRWNTQ